MSPLLSFLGGAVRNMRVGLLQSPAFLGHRPPQPHVEGPERLSMLGDLSSRLPFQLLTPSAASEEDVRLVHDPNLLSAIARADACGGGWLDGDTFVVEDSLATALLALGSCVRAAEAVAEGELDHALLLVRPPGHHASRGRSSGFCLLNNAAATAERLVRAGLRPAIVDWDVHHGNGTEAIFRERADVLTVSLHQAPLYPFSGGASDIGAGEGLGCAVNVPLPQGCTDADYEFAFLEACAPLIDEFAPDALVVSAGFDGHRDDPLGGMRMTAPGYARLLERAREAGKRPPVLIALEGGYSPAAIAESVTACAEALFGQTPPPAEGGPSEEAREYVVRAVAERREALS